MIDYYGKWTYDPDMPEDKMRDMDRVAQMVSRNGYEPMTTMENLVSMIALSYKGYLEDECLDFYAVENDSDDYDFNIEDIESYIYDNGGFSEFDYYS